MNKVATLLKKTLTQVFSREFCENFQNIYSTEHLGATVSDISIEFMKCF